MFYFWHREKQKLNINENDKEFCLNIGNWNESTLLSLKVIDTFFPQGCIIKCILIDSKDYTTWKENML